jgi:glutamate-1-semialdehyde aminotransferase
MNGREYLKKWTPGGSQTRSKRDLFDWPQTVDYADGAYVYDGDREYIDWIAGLAAVGLGYRHWKVDEAVRRQIMAGVTFPLPTRLEGEVAELLCETLKWPEQVRWVKTGSEATDGAMLIARAATGRRKIVSIGYHGWHQTHLPGPDVVSLPIHSMGWDRHVDGDTAAVLVEPMRDNHVGDAGEYLRDLQDYCRDVGALFILDEIVTGFRWAIGGASEYFGITPDLACYGKAMANGYPIAAIVGGKGLMAHAIGVSSTFGGEGIGLAAAKATIQVYRSEPVIDTLWARGKQLMAGVPELVGYPVHPHFPGEGKWDGERSARCQRAAEWGVLVHPAGMNPMYAHTEEDVKKTIEALSSAPSA